MAGAEREATAIGQLKVAIEPILSEFARSPRARSWYIVGASGFLAAILGYSLEAVARFTSGLVLSTARLPEQVSTGSPPFDVSSVAIFVATQVYVVATARAKRLGAWSILVGLPAFLVVCLALTAEGLVLYASFGLASGHMTPSLVHGTSSAVNLGRYVFTVAAVALLVLWGFAISLLLRRDTSTIIGDLSVALLGVSSLALSAALTTYVGRSASDSTLSSTNLGLALLLFVWSIGIVVFLPSGYLSRRGGAAAARRRASTKAGAAVSSARSLSLGLFALAALAGSAASTYNSQAAFLSQARATFASSRATGLFSESAADGGCPPADACAWKVPGIGAGAMFAVDKPRMGFEFSAKKQDGSHWTVLRYAPPRSVVRASCADLLAGAPETKTLMRCWIRNVKQEDHFAQLAEIATLAGLEPPSSAREGLDSGRLFRFVEQSLTSHTVAVPNVGLSFRIIDAAWLIELLSIAVLITMRGHLESAGRSADGGADEAWLVLDPCSGFDRLLSIAWSAGIFVSPWLVAGALLVTLASRWVADGVGDYRSVEFLRWASAMTLNAVGGWLALTLMSQIVWLKRVRAVHA